MKLYIKVLKITILSILLGICLLYAFSRNLMMKNANNLETEKVVSDTIRVSRFIKKDLQTMDTLNLEYSQWDETYAFMENHNEQYLNSNFSDLISFKNLNIAFLAFVDYSGKTLFTKDVTSSLPLSPDLKQNIQKDIISKINSFDNSKRLSGILISNNIPVFISAQPIIKNDGSGLPRGTFILAKYFDDSALKTLSGDLKLNIKVKKYNPTLLKNSIIYNNIHVKIQNNNTISGYFLMNDIFATPSLITAVDMPRDIYKNVQDSLMFFLFILSLICFLCTALVVISLNKIIIRKIFAIKTAVDSITNTGNLSLRIDEKGDDEITELSKKLNKMFNTLQKSEKELTQLAYFDTLTTLPNRKNILESIEQLIQNNLSKFALFFIDLNNFKNINDSLGHNAGDFILQKSAENLSTIMDKNCLLGRLGGDEFIIVQNYISSVEETEKLAEEICNILRHPIKYGEHEIYVSASIGISIYPDDGEDLPTLMKNSDTAMYAAKKNKGYSYKTYSKNMNSQALDELIIKNNLQKALENNEFILHFQPIYNIAKMDIIGAEALIRWKFKDKLIYPNDFIQKAKDIGQIVYIDNWVLRNACLACKKWHEKGFKDIYISVNISFNQLKQQNFLDIVKDALNQSKLAPTYLNLEITEDESMEDVELTITTLNQLKDLGITISLDDFGKGYSSLSYVNTLPINTLKIDKSLIRFLDKDSKNHEIIKTIIVMAHSLNVKVVAEGIETEDQLDILKELKCNAMQGYLIGKPVDTEDFENSFLKK
ncbi:EAL domain-containing protein [Clostridium ganghwense]|uniref:EAL domain-containing protein n=1 Tax=Clostridium ganghwense TaxID=312089 RepID=A0ABT4CML2_9CLOT|nr:EAL domain-containing protein [Clostridium ganghwense]MCY6369239.1 EAL domain-containing protein [Clostridium ganghwense]